MGSILNLDATITRQANASGIAVCQIGPSSAGESWQIDTVTVQTTDPTNIPVATLYKNVQTPSGVVASSARGNNDTDTTAGIDLMELEQLYCVWNGCAPNVYATLTVRGKRMIGGYFN